MKMNWKKRSGATEEKKSQQQHNAVEQTVDSAEMNKQSITIM